MCITHSPKIFRKSFDRITRFAKKSFQIFFFFLITTNESSRRWFPMERQFYESHISPLPSSLFSSFPYLDDSSFFAYHFFFLIPVFLLPVLLALKKATLCLLSRLVRTTSIDYFLAFAMHKNACVFFIMIPYYSFFLTFFYLLRHHLSHFSLFLSLPLLVSDPSYLFPSCPPIGLLLLLFLLLLLLLLLLSTSAYFTIDIN